MQEIKIRKFSQIVGPNCNQNQVDWLLSSAALTKQWAQVLLDQKANWYN